MIGSRMPVGDVAERVVARRPCRPGATADRAGRTPSGRTARRRPAGRCPARSRRCGRAARSSRRAPQNPVPVDDADQQHHAARRRTPPAMCAPKISPSDEEVDDLAAAMTPRRARPAEHDRHARDRRGDEAVEEPALDLERGGDARRRRRRASATGIIAAASWKSRKPWTGGKPGRSVLRCRPPMLIARNSEGKMTQRREELRAAQRVAQRAARERHATRAQRRLAVIRSAAAARLRRRPRGGGRSCRRRRRRASGCTSSSDATEQAGLVERADDRGDLGGAAGDARSRAWQPSRGGRVGRRSAPSTSRALERAQSSASVGERHVEVRAADLGLQRRRRALGDDPAGADDPDAVGELVGLLEVLRGQEDRRALVACRRRTSSHSVMRETGSRPVVGSSRNSTSGEWISAIARSRRRRMPPE